MSTYPYGNGHLSGVGWRAVTHTIPHGHLLVGRGVGEGQLLTSCQHTHKVTVTSAVGGGGREGGGVNGGCYSRTIMNKGRENKGTGQK